jgi:hypothetical protein
MPISEVWDANGTLLSRVETPDPPSVEEVATGVLASTSLAKAKAVATAALADLTT